MRAALPLLLLSGCLAAPAPPSPSEDSAGADAGAMPADAPSIHCVSGSMLDLAYVNSISYFGGGGGQIALVGSAVFINPGPDTIVLPGFSASAEGIADAILAIASVGGAEGGLMLLPGEAKGALQQTASAVVRNAFSENWVDSEQPSLAESFSIGDSAPNVSEDSFAIPIQVKAGDYIFDIVVTLVEDESKTTGTPLTAARATATCE